MENIAFEQLAQAVGVPVAVGIWIWWQSRGSVKSSDIGDEVVRELKELSQRLTRLEVIVDERTRR